MENKKSNKLIIGLVIVLIVGIGTVGFKYLKQRYFNTDYIQCYERIESITKDYQKLKDRTDKGLDRYIDDHYHLNKHTYMNHDIVYTKYKEVCPKGGTITFVINKDKIVGRCSKHEAKYLSKKSKVEKIYADSYYLLTTFDEDLALTNASLQQAVFYYESGVRHGSFPQVTIHKQKYAIMPYYHKDLKEVILIGVKELNPYKNDGTTLKEVTQAQVIYDASQQSWVIKNMDMSQFKGESTLKNHKRYTSKDIVFDD